MTVYKGQHVLAASLDPDPALAGRIAAAGLADLMEPAPAEFSREALANRALLARRPAELIWSPVRLGLVEVHPEGAARPEPVSVPVPAQRRGQASDLELMLDEGILRPGEELVGVRNGKPARPARRRPTRRTPAAK